MERVLKKNPDIIWKDVKGETILLNPINGKYFGLNKVGCVFWEKIDGVRSLPDIAELLLGDFNVEKERLLKDLEDLIKTLQENNLVTID
ncbi:MAG TPA: PqqD family protein [Smithella sp.]|nr:PqqD family protein [Smithella sp.]